MATFVILLRWTDKGIEHIKESPQRYEQFCKALENVGGRVTDFHFTMGEYDMVAVFEAPDDETGANMSLSLRSLGNVQVETLRAFNEEDFRRIVSTLP